MVYDFYLPKPDALLKSMNERTGKRNTLGSNEDYCYTIQQLRY